MATVLDASGNSRFAADKKLETPNTIVTRDPYSVTTPNYVGEIVYDRINHRYYRATGTANTDWIAVNGAQTPSALARATAFGLIGL